VRRFAKKHGVDVYRFSYGVEGEQVDDAEAEMHFAHHAPAFITHNLAPFTRGVANGTVCKLHAMSFTSPPISERDSEGIIRLMQPPTAIIVQLKDGSLFPIIRRQITTQLENKISAFPFSLGFSCTFHKSQGATLDCIVIDLNKTPKILGALQHASLYVAISRVRSGADIRVLPPRGEGLGYLTNLSPPKGLEEWLLKNLSISGQ
jgi:hypothetical protein